MTIKQNLWQIFFQFLLNKTAKTQTKKCIEKTFFCSKKEMCTSMSCRLLIVQ